MSRSWFAAWSLVTAGFVHAQGVSSAIVDCAQLALTRATGVADAAANQHRYEFAGSCRLSERKNGVVRDVRSFPVRASATWDVRQKRYEETVRVSGGFSWDGKSVGGEMHSAFRCSDDPLAQPAACNGFEHRNGTALEPLSNAYRQNGRPLLVGHAVLAPPGPVMPVKPSAPPDLTATANVTIGGKTSSWGGEVQLDAAKAIAKETTSGGLCTYPVSYSLRNLGLSPSGAFKIKWAGAKGWSKLLNPTSVAPGGTKGGTTPIKLSSGAGQLVLLIDSANDVAEIDEHNNQFGIRITITGSCMPGDR
jgi:hypothetical protein